MKIQFLEFSERISRYGYDGDDFVTGVGSYAA